MKLLKILFLNLMLVNSSVTFAAAQLQGISVPFENIALDPNVSIEASYSFGDYPIIFCYENNFQTVGVLTWTYNGGISSSTLLMSLITDANYQGAFADPVGTLTVTNNQTYQLIVSCLFAL